MKRIHRASAAFAALIGALVFGLNACTVDGPSAPQAPEIAAPAHPPADLLGLDLGGVVSGVVGTVPGLLDLVLFPCETPSYGTVTQTVGRYGGTIKVGPHSLYIPPGALSAPVAITATTETGSQVRVDFQPHGLRFERPAVLTLGYGHCEASPVRPKIVYVESSGGFLSIVEQLPSLDSQSGERVTGELRHFSGYAIAD